MTGPTPCRDRFLPPPEPDGHEDVEGPPLFRTFSGSWGFADVDDGDMVARARAELDGGP